MSAYNSPSTEYPSCPGASSSAPSLLVIAVQVLRGVTGHSEREVVEEIPRLETGPAADGQRLALRPVEFVPVQVHRPQVEPELGVAEGIPSLLHPPATPVELVGLIERGLALFGRDDGLVQPTGSSAAQRSQSRPPGVTGGAVGRGVGSAAGCSGERRRRRRKAPGPSKTIQRAGGLQGI